ncbi:hypothetical protein [Streptomyces sp. NPDC002209]|uniref:hypothetical protein n=1 Tax=Streptomyces sp. NPDC002209 TaxID=3364638 RepID=UPI0036A3839E
MELRTLEYFVAVAEELEEELGEPLFERLPRQVVLTSHASPVLAADPRFVVVPLEPAIRLRKVFV